VIEGKMYHTPYIGGDPELYLKGGNGLAIPSHRYYGDLHRNSIVRDGAALELNPTPDSCRDRLVGKMATALHHVQHTVADRMGATISVDPIVEIDPKELEGAPEDTFEFGCKPDWNAYTQRMQQPTCPPGSMLRYTGGHLHLQVPIMTKDRIRRYLKDEIRSDELLNTGNYGYGFGSNSNTILINDESQRLETFSLLAQMADIFIGVPMVAVLGEIHADGEAERRGFYGQAGSFRMPKHGFEYRTLSSRAVLLSPVLTYLVYGLLRIVSYQSKNPGVYQRSEKVDYDLWRQKYYGVLPPPESMVTVGRMRRRLHYLHNGIADAETIQRVINTHDVKEAEKLTKTMIEYVRRSQVFWMDEVVADFLSAIIATNNEGVSWKNDVRTNWGLDAYTNLYGCGIEAALCGRIDDDMFPQTFLFRDLSNFYDEEYWDGHWDRLVYTNKPDKRRLHIWRDNEADFVDGVVDEEEYDEFDDEYYEDDDHYWEEEE